MFKIFITESIYDNVMGNVKKRKTLLYKIMKWQEEQEEQTKKQLLFKLNIEETERYENESYQKEVLNNPSSLYILDISKETARNIRRKYGVMCVSGDNPDISLLVDVDDFFKPNVGVNKYDGWDKVLDNVECLPCNALLLTDKYLFSSNESYKNVRQILNELLPKSFSGGEFHVTIVFSEERLKWDIYKSFDDIADGLNDIVEDFREKLDYGIMLEVLGLRNGCCIVGKLHSRRILSNYYFVEATHKLAAFKKDFTGTVQQTIIPWALFTNSGLMGPSSMPLESMDETLETFRGFNKQYEDLNSPYFYYEVYNDSMDSSSILKNRLLKE